MHAPIGQRVIGNVGGLEIDRRYKLQRLKIAGAAKCKGIWKLLLDMHSRPKAEGL